MKDFRRIYKYGYGSEDYPCIIIKIYQNKLENNRYIVIYEQTSVNDKFKDIISKYQILSKEKTTDYDESEGLYWMKTKLEVKTILNPPPEDIFSII